MTHASVEILMPEVAASMTSATLAAWLRQPGDRVTAGEPIAEVETDKTTVELESPADGILDDIRVDAGTEGVRVGTLLGRIRPAAEDDADAPPVSSPPAPVRRGAPSAAYPAAGRRETPAATPLAARMAAHAGMDITAVAASGAGGRTTKHDVERTLGVVASPGEPMPAAGREAPPASPLLPGLSSDIPYRDEALTAVRRVTAERMANAKSAAPHFYLSIDCAVDRLLKRRAKANAAVAMDQALTLNDIVVRAAALALAAVPEANVAWTGAAIRRFARVDLAVAVAIDGGLITPIVRAADTKDVMTIAAELRDLTDRARVGRLAPGEYTGGTCTVSNLGMFGVSSLYPILNPPQGCILGIGAVQERPVVRKKKVRAARMLTATLAADHRALDGATGADLLRTFRRLLEDPGLLFA